MKKSLLLTLAVYCLLPMFAASAAYEITSPFGWRTHPIYGRPILHAGADIAADVGEGILAPASGTVVSYGWVSGYGNYMEIQNDADGALTCFAHLTGAAVPVGAHVAKNQLVAFAGATGNVTGPHIHVERRLGYDNPVDPIPWLISCGWDVTGQTYSVPGEGIMQENAAPLPFQFGDVYDIARQVRATLEDFATACQNGLRHILAEVVNLIKFLMLLDLTLLFAFFLLQHMDDENKDLWQMLARRFIKYGFLLFLIANWPEFVNTFILDSMTQLGGLIGGAPAIAADNLSDPGLIMQKGIHLIEPVFTYIAQYNTNIWLLDAALFTYNAGKILLALALALLIFACFAWIGFTFFLTYLEFYIVALLSIVYVPFGVCKHTQFLAGAGFQTLFCVAFRLLLMVACAGIVVHSVTDFQTPAYEPLTYLRLLLAALALALLSWLLPRRLAHLLAGQPKF